MLISDGLADFTLNSGFKSAFDTDGRVSVFAGSAPGSAGAAIANTQLSRNNMAATAFGSASGRVITANAIANDTAADNSGTPTFAIVHKNGETAITSAAGGSDKRALLLVGARTTLNGALSGVEATITVVDTTYLPASGSVIIGSSIVNYTGKTATTLTGCTGTPAAASGANVLEGGKEMWFDNTAFAANGIVAITQLTVTL
jgi:hypothetical protein